MGKQTLIRLQFTRLANIDFALPGIIFFSALTLCLLNSNSSEAVRGVVIVAKKVNLDKKVLFLNTPHAERVFTVGWIGRDGQVWEKRHASRKGFHAYEMRDHIAWKGYADSVSIMGLKVDSARVDLPDISAEMDIFLAFEPWMRSSVNALWGHTLLGFSWDRVLLLFGLLFAVAVFFVKRGSASFSTCLLSGFVFLMVFVEVHSVCDHLRMAEELKKNESIAQTSGLALFSARLAERIGEQHWSADNEKLPSIAAINIAYGLAEKRYAPPSLTHIPRFVITYLNGGIVLVPPGR